MAWQMSLWLSTEAETRLTTLSLPQPCPDCQNQQFIGLAKIVQRAVRLYYKVNTIGGCTDATSSRFNFEANVDHGSCHADHTNFTFGGVYQKCYTTHFNSAGNLCESLQQKNPLTGDLSCPEGYQAVELLKARSGEKPVVTKSYHQTHCRKVCRRCGFLLLKDCCHTSCQNIFHYSRVQFQAFWCAAVGPVEANSGMLFGGVYSSTEPNPVTGSQSCPHRFYSMPFGGHSHVCVSDDYELGFQFALKFAGFFSCTSGNPLAVPHIHPQGDKKPQGKNAKRIPSVEFFLEGDVPGTFQGPQSCPCGYSQHLLAVDNECEINYCVKANSLAKLTSTAVKRPPYNPRPGVSPNATKTLMVVGVNGEVWYKNDSQAKWTLASFAARDDDDDSSDPLVSSDQTKPMSQGTAVVLSVCATVLAGILAIAVFTGYRRRQLSRQYRDADLREVLMPGETTPLNPENA